MLAQPGYREFASETGAAARRVERVWSFQAERSGDYRVLPDGRLDLIVRFELSGTGAVVNPRIVIAGPSGRWFDTPVLAGTSFLGVRFRAGWGPACLGVSGGALRDRVFVGPEASALVGADADALMEAGEPRTLRAALAALAQRRANQAADRAKDSQVAAALDLLHLSGGRTGAADLAGTVGAPERSLRRDLTEAVGLPVKALAGILRFQRTLRLIHRAGLALADAAYEGGYSDQSHMTREFQRLGGVTPGRLPELTLVTLDGLAS